jgi:HAE1 family hydrophobic/amphiphilic exporter-1
VATLFSLTVSFSIVPLLSSRFGKLERLNPQSFIGKGVHAFESGINRIAESFSHLLNWSFLHKILVFGITFIALVGSLSLVATGFIGSEFGKSGDQGQFIINIELPRSATLEQTNDIAFQAESIIRSSPLVATVFTTVGAEENGQAQACLAEIRVKMIPYGKRDMSDMDLAREIKLALQKNIAGAKFRSATSGLMGDVDDAPVQYYVSGNSMDSVLSAANRLLAGMSAVRGVLDMELEINNIFNTIQYVSASYNDVSVLYYSYELRPLSVLMSVRFKLK